MTRAVSVRLDDDVLHALRIVEATGMSRSDAILASILGEAARLRERSSLAAEAAALHSDEADRREMRSVAEMMGALRGPG